LILNQGVMKWLGLIVLKCCTYKSNSNQQLLTNIHKSP